MANFKMHLAGAATAGAIAAITSVALFGKQGVGLAGAALIAGSVGGLLPDIDHDHAVPVRELFSLLAAVVPTALSPLLLNRGISAEWTLVVCAAGYILIRFAVAPLFKWATVHRGIFHSIPFILCAGELTMLALPSLPVRHRIFLGATVALGALVHLGLDEFYAIDFTGKRLKKSFGTALKFVAPSKPATIACYVALLVLTIISIQAIRKAPSHTTTAARNQTVTAPLQR